MNRTADLNENIVKLRAQLAEAEAAQDKFAGLPENKRLAVLLHEKQCAWNHTDGCFWFYDNDYNADNWVRDTTRKRYLDKADTLLTLLDFPTAVKVITAI